VLAICGNRSDLVTLSARVDYSIRRRNFTFAFLQTSWPDLQGAWCDAKREATMTIPAAQYLRMSTEDQQYSMANQSLHIQEYAGKHGFAIVKTYEDPGKSGVMIKHRDGLSALLKDVVTYRQLYERLGYDLDARYVSLSDQLQRSKNLRVSLVDELKRLFPDHVSVALSRNGARAILRIDDAFMVSIVFCRPARIQKGRCWAMKPNPAERGYITLLCLLNRRHDRVLQYYVAPRLVSCKHHRFYPSGPFLRQTVKLVRLSDFYATVIRLWNERASF